MVGWGIEWMVREDGTGKRDGGEKEEGMMDIISDPILPSWPAFWSSNRATVVESRADGR